MASTASRRSSDRGAARGGRRTPRRFSFIGSLTAHPSGSRQIVLPRVSTRWFGRRTQVAVRGEIEHHPIRSTVLPTGDGRHFLYVNQRLLRRLGRVEGARLRVVLEPAPRRRVRMAPELTAALERSVTSREHFLALTPAARQVAMTWIAHAKHPEIRRKRVADVLRRARRAYHGRGPFYPQRGEW